jgi:hypothetical protein
VSATGRHVGGVVAGFGSSAYVGHAIAGGICLSSFAGLAAGCIVSDVPLARVDLTSADVSKMPVVHSAFAALGGRHHLIVEGARDGTAVLVDGNPFAILGPQDQAEVRVRSGALRCLRRAHSSMGPGPGSSLEEEI